MVMIVVAVELPIVAGNPWLGFHAGDPQPEFLDQRLQPLGAQPDLHAVGPKIDLLDQQPDDARLLRREQLVPQRRQVGDGLDNIERSMAGMPQPAELAGLIVAPLSSIAISRACLVLSPRGRFGPPAPARRSSARAIAARSSCSVSASISCSWRTCAAAWQAASSCCLTLGVAFRRSPAVPSLSSSASRTAVAATGASRSGLATLGAASMPAASGTASAPSAARHWAALSRPPSRPPAAASTSSAPRPSHGSGRREWLSRQSVTAATRSRVCSISLPIAATNVPVLF